MKRPLESYADAHALNVWTGTWNTNGNRRSRRWTSRRGWTSPRAPTWWWSGAQEIVPLTPGKVLMQEDGAQATGEWETIIDPGA